MTVRIDRVTALAQLRSGDLFYARDPHTGIDLIAITTAITLRSLEARDLGTQHERRFDRRTGQEHRGYAVIESIAPLPLDLHQRLQTLDRHMRLSQTWTRSPMPNADQDTLDEARTIWGENLLPSATPRQPPNA